MRTKEVYIVRNLTTKEQPPTVIGSGAFVADRIITCFKRPGKILAATSSRVARQLISPLAPELFF
jgi:hypothetical protein